MTAPDHARSDESAKSDLRYYLQSARDALLWKLEGLSEYDVRRPHTPTGTNLLGLVKHVAGVELGYLGDTFGRPSGKTIGTGWNAWPGRPVGAPDRAWAGGQVVGPDPTRAWTLVRDRTRAWALVGPGPQPQPRPWLQPRPRLRLRPW